MSFVRSGLHAWRLATQQDNPREVAFVEQWQCEHGHDTEPPHRDLLDELLQVPISLPAVIRKPGTALHPIGPATERDRIVAATVVQWLGSNCGMSFLREALRRCGYRVVEES